MPQLGQPGIREGGPFSRLAFVAAFGWRTNMMCSAAMPVLPSGLSMIRLCQKMLLYLAAASDRELARQVQYLREENRIRRSKLPKRIAVTPRERNRLAKFGKGLGAALK